MYAFASGKSNSGKEEAVNMDKTNRKQFVFIHFVFNTLPWHIAYLKLKEFEKIEKAGRSITYLVISINECWE